MRRKILALILSTALMITSVPFFATTAFAASPAITISSATATPGDSVDLTVTISGNPGITSIDFSVQYDQTQLELTAKQNGKLLGGTSYSQTLTKVPYYCGWINSLQEVNCTDNGVLITLTFKVKDGATNGKKAISFTESSITAYDANIKKVVFATNDGYIEVTGGKTESSKTDTQAGGSSGAVTPTSPTDQSTDSAETTDTTEVTDKTGNSDSTQAADNTQTLTASQMKIIAKVEDMNIKLTSAKYTKSKTTYTIKYKKTNKSYKLDGYVIYRSTKKSSGYTKVGKTTKLTWTDKKLGKKGKTYYYKIRGYRKVAGKTYYTNWSAKKKLTVK